MKTIILFVTLTMFVSGDLIAGETKLKPEIIPVKTPQGLEVE